MASATVSSSSPSWLKLAPAVIVLRGRPAARSSRTACPMHVTCPGVPRRRRRGVSIVVHLDELVAHDDAQALVASASSWRSSSSYDQVGGLGVGGPRVLGRLVVGGPGVQRLERVVERLAVEADDPPGLGVGVAHLQPVELVVVERAGEERDGAVRGLVVINGHGLRRFAREPPRRLDARVVGVAVGPQPLRRLSLILSLRPYRGVRRLRLPPCSQQEAKIGSRHQATRHNGLSGDGIIGSLQSNCARDTSMHDHVAYSRLRPGSCFESDYASLRRL